MYSVMLTKQQFSTIPLHQEDEEVLEVSLDDLGIIGNLVII